MTDVRAALENALAADPDDEATHMAYADLLMEQGDPRGELIQIQLDLEPASLPQEKRKALEAREREILDTHLRQWLGDLAPYLLDQKDLAKHHPNPDGDICFRYLIRRGWLYSLELPLMNVAMARALRDLPFARLLIRLAIDSTRDDWRGENGYESGLDTEIPIQYRVGLNPLLEAPFLETLEELKLGQEPGDSFSHSVGYGEEDPYDFWPMGGTDCAYLIQKTQRLESLHLYAHEVDEAKLGIFQGQNLSQLHTLVLYHWEYPWKDIASNPALGNLYELRCHPHADMGITLEDLEEVVRSPYLKNLRRLQLRLCSAGDDGCRAIVDSGILAQLLRLDLRHGCVTDVGAAILAQCPAIKNLTDLDLQRNRLTSNGIKILRATGIPHLRLDYQQEPEEWDEDYYFAEGDWE